MYEDEVDLGLELCRFLIFPIHDTFLFSDKNMSGN